MRYGLKAKTLLGFGLLAVLVVLAFGYGSWTFRQLEKRMEAVNDSQVPALKALNQMESSFFLLESDLDKSLNEGIFRPIDTLESVISSRLDFLRRLAAAEGASDPVLSGGISGLRVSYQACADVLAKIYNDWEGRATYAEELSVKRADFRLKLKTLVRDLDQEMRSVSTNVQKQLSRLAIVLAIFLATCGLATFLFSLWLAKSLRPLESLAQVMRGISARGLDENAVKNLAEIPQDFDEIGTLARESLKMASSLLDNTKLLKDQKQNLERAHVELGRQNEELRTAQAKLIHSEKLGVVGRMAAQMAHEIRNPLNALNLHAELLEDQITDNPRAKESMAPIRKEINRLIAVTESYLDLARAPRLQRSAVQLNEIVEELHDLYEPVLKEKGIYFTCDLGELPPVEVDRGQLVQVVGNLLKNASEAFEGVERAGASYIRVITQANAAKRELQLTIFDNGGGMSAEQQKNIFSPFHTTKAQGTGLGLTYSRQVLEAHGGDITFDSSYRQGTKFTLRLPVADWTEQNGEAHGRV
ncbi:MAG: sensor histidine kinase [Bacteriovoracia bacterium]